MAPAVSPFATSLNPAPPARQPVKKPGGGVRRFVSWMVLLAALGGIAYAGITYGPELMDRAKGDTVDEPEAPLAFPVAATELPPIRTATYTVDAATATGGHTYTVTTDYESGITRVVVDRDGIADLEMMAVFDGTVVRRADDPLWYQLPRGDFPIGRSAGRLRWVRTLDELLTPTLRSLATIERSTESLIDGVPTRRLLLAVDGPRLAAALAGDASSVSAAPPADGAEAVSDIVEEAPPAEAVLPPGVTLAADADLTVTLEIEVWVDDSGVVRKLILPPALGGESVTVTEVSADPFAPVFPTPDQILPLTADALLALGS